VVERSVHIGKVVGPIPTTPTNMNKEVSVVVINYNNAQYLERCLRPLFVDPVIKEVIVVDDRSTDNSIELLRNFPAKVIRNERNMGPVAARNIGAREATGNYLLFVDADAQIGPTYASALAQFLEDNEKVGIVTGKTISETGERIWWNFGYDPHPFRGAIGGLLDRCALFVWRYLVLRRIIGWISQPFSQNLASDEVRSVDWVVEMAFMTRRNIFNTLEGLDEGFYMFFEGPDFCRRVRELGSTVVYLPYVSVQHLGGHSHPETRGRFFKESRERYFKKYS
jgi:N-acetylglucosaminyl-diphospho-decaprenol L-rhamnosyltransferase